nr:DUF2892 domain-containing protein [uncultured Psychroserpens sp.]
MGKNDKVIRIVIAVVIAVLYWQGIIEGTLAYILLAFSAIFVLTSLISFCPLYPLFGINTCKVKK